MHDPDTLIFTAGPLMVWHHDPCKGGSGDDSCGWYMRAHHGNPEVLKRIVSGITMDWKHLFSETGDPLMSTSGIVLQIFWWAAFEHFNNGKKAKRWMRANLYDLLWFAENPIDSLHAEITGKYGSDQERKERRIESLASCAYGWLLRSTRPWYRHPRFHFNHWRVTCRPFWRRWTRQKV